MTIWALDLATKMGWAAADDAAAPRRSGIVTLSSKHRGEAYAGLRSWLMRNIMDGDKIWVEQAHHRGGATTRKLLGLFAMVELHAFDRGCWVGTVHASTYRAGLIPKGKPKGKDDYMALARIRWPGIRDDNEADAMLLLDWVLRMSKA